MSQSHQHESKEIVVDDSIVLKPRSFDNEAAVYALIEKDRSYLSKWIFWTADYTPEKLHQDIVDTLQETAEGTLYIFDVFFKGVLAGAVDAHNVISGQSAEVGYWIGEDFAGKGLATKSTRKLIEFIHETCNVSNFSLEAIVGNEASIRVADKLGFKFGEYIDNKEHNVREARYSRTL